MSQNQIAALVNEYYEFLDWCYMLDCDARNEAIESSELSDWDYTDFTSNAQSD